MADNPYAPPSGPPPERQPPQPWGPPGWSGGWDVPRDPEHEARERRRRGLTFGIVSLALLAGAVVVVLFALVLALFGGFIFLPVAAVIAAVAVGFAIASVVVLARAGGSVSRLLAGAPAAVTLAIVAAIPLSAAFESDKPPPVPKRPAPAAATPDEVVREMIRTMSFDRWGQACLLLAERARPPGCADAKPLCEYACRSVHLGDVDLVRQAGSRALVSYASSSEGTRRMVRLERGPNGWELLDVPGLGTRCVDTARDPFTCPVLPVAPSQ